MSMTVGELVAYLDVDDRKFKAGLDSSEGRFTKFGGFLKKGAIAAGVGVTALVGTAIVKGFQRLTSIENAEAKLTGLGHSAQSVSGIMDNALASVRGTAFGLDEAAGVAASVVAAGVKPGQQLESTLKLVADASTIAGTSMGEMGTIFNKVATSNKLQGEVIQQLNERGIPIVQMLAKSLGKTTDEVLDMSAKGQISFKDFSKAMEKGLGGAALESGNTTVGAFKNMGAALSRFGQSLLTGVFPLIGPMFKRITEGLDWLTAAVGPFFENLGKGLGEWLKGDQAAGIFDAIKGAIAALIPVAMRVIGWMRAAWPQVSAAIAYVWAIVKPVLIEFAQTAIVVGRRVAKAVAAVVGFIREHWGTIGPIVRNAWVVVSTIVKTALKVIAAVVRAVMAVIRGDWSAAWTQIKSALSAIAKAWPVIVRGAIKLVIAAIKGIGKLALAAVAGFGRLLWDAGKALIEGLINGITGKLGDLKDTLSGVASSIVSWKGPLDYDRVLLRPAGQAIIGGLMAGIDDQLGALYSQVSGIGPRLAIAATPSMALAVAPASAAPAPRKPQVVIDARGSLFGRDAEVQLARMARNGEAVLYRQETRTSGGGW